MYTYKQEMPDNNLNIYYPTTVTELPICNSGDGVVNTWTGHTAMVSVEWQVKEMSLLTDHHLELTITVPVMFASKVFDILVGLDPSKPQVQGKLIYRFVGITPTADKPKVVVIGNRDGEPETYALKLANERIKSLELRSENLEFCIKKLSEVIKYTVLESVSPCECGSRSRMFTSKLQELPIPITIDRVYPVITVNELHQLLSCIWGKQGKITRTFIDTLYKGFVSSRVRLKSPEHKKACYDLCEFIKERQALGLETTKREMVYEACLLFNVTSFDGKAVLKSVPAIEALVLLFNAG